MDWATREVGRGVTWEPPEIRREGRHENSEIPPNIANISGQMLAHGAPTRGAAHN